MPRVTGDRFSSQNMSDCEFCLPDGRRFRTTRQCARCSRALCIVCRPWSPAAEFLCPECGGGPREDGLHAPADAIQKLETAGLPIPFWLLVVQERTRGAEPAKVDEEIVPE